MSHRFQQQPRQGQPTDQYGQQPTQSMGGPGQQTGGQQMAGQEQPMTGRRQQMGGPGQQIGGPGQQMGGQEMRSQQSFEDHLTKELRIALEDFTELGHIADWCAKTHAAEGLSAPAHITHDIAELAELNASMIARDSMFGPEVADAFIRVATESLPELRQYQQHPHISETISAIDRTIDSCSTVLEMVHGGPQMGGQQRTDEQQIPTGGMGGGQEGTYGRGQGSGHGMGSQY